ncbi:MAG: hypothetical protein GF403_10770 [Candidatus Coatesbacteria bacterium]|nr:hypothetical protein [Candidatus Coatesbacteria bacterium]
MDWGAFGLGAGIGAIISGVIVAIIQGRNSFKSFLRKKRLELYIQAYTTISELNTSNNEQEILRQRYELHNIRSRVNMISSKQVRNAYKDFVESEPNSDERDLSETKLHKTIRSELGIND